MLNQWSRVGLRLVVVLGALGFAGSALAQDTVHGVLNETSMQVKATSDPDQKREILTRSLGAVSRAIETVQGAPLTSAQDNAALERLQGTIREKSDELAGLNGFERVPDNQLDAFSTYVVQDMEQAERTVTISLVAALLIVIIIILVA